jgi:hypothetical protein
MTLDEIIAMWQEDAEIDTASLGRESLKIPVLHSKYLKFYYEERRRLKAYQLKNDSIYLNKNQYYAGKMSQEDLKEQGWEPFQLSLLKAEVSMYVQGDREIITSNVKIISQKEKIDILQEIIKCINQRSFQLKGAMDWLQFTNGEL